MPHGNRWLDYGILPECRDTFSISLCGDGRRFPILKAMN